MKKIAVLITSFNRKCKTLGCLANLYTQQGYKSKFDIDVYLVDDASTDGTADAVRSRFPAVHLIIGTGDLYWNGGMHRAWEVAKEGNYDFYLWLNDDTVLFSDAINEMLAYSLGNEPTVICGAISSANGDNFTYGGSTKDGRPVLPNGQIQNCFIINGNCVLVNKLAYQCVGNLDPVFPHGIGDHDYGLRLLEKGGILVTTKKYVASCERNEKLPIWCYGETPLFKRIKSLYSPLGNSHPIYYFIYERRHFGLLIAIKHYLSIHLRVLIPSLWK